MAKWTRKEMDDLEEFLRNRFPLMNIRVEAHPSRVWQLVGDDLDNHENEIVAALNEYLPKPIKRSDMGKIHCISA